MNYYRKQEKNASLRGEKKEWVKITLWLLFVVVVTMFGTDLLNFLSK